MFVSELISKISFLSLSLPRKQISEVCDFHKRHNFWYFMKLLMISPMIVKYNFFTVVYQIWSFFFSINHANTHVFRPKSSRWVFFTKRNRRFFSQFIIKSSDLLCKYVNILFQIRKKFTIFFLFYLCMIVKVLKFLVD